MISFCLLNCVGTSQIEWSDSHFLLNKNSYGIIITVRLGLSGAAVIPSERKARDAGDRSHCASTLEKRYYDSYCITVASETALTILIAKGKGPKYPFEYFRAYISVTKLISGQNSVSKFPAVLFLNWRPILYRSSANICHKFFHGLGSVIASITRWSKIFK